MKIDRSKLKRTSAEIPADCKALIDKLKNCNPDQLLYELKQIKSWSCAKCELYHWVDLLDIFDDILGKSCERQHENQWTLPCDSPNWDPKKRELIIQIMSFTALLIEHSFSRHLYSSMDHLITLLSSSDMQIVLAVLGLIFVFGKRSNFIAKLSIEKRQELFNRLSYLAESWGGKENGFGLAECCRDLPMSSYPSSATTLHFEYYTDHNHKSINSSEPTSMPAASVTTNPILHNAGCPNAQPAESIYSQPPQTYSQAVRQPQRTMTSTSQAQFEVSQDKRSIDVIHIDNVDQIKDESLASIMERLVATHDVPREKQMQLFTHLRLAHCFSDPVKRIQCVQARLQAISVIIYCAPATSQEIGAQLLYNGFVEELVDILQLEGNHYIDIKSAALRTLTSIIHIDRNSRLSTIIEATETSSYHGFLPILVRNCIQSLINEDDRFPIPYATALFSFLYHLASFEKGGEALVSCGMMESLLKVISWTGTEPEHITFVTRSVRVIDLMTGMDMTVFQTQSGLNIFVERLEAEVKMCRKELGEDFDDIEMNQNMDETSSDSQQPMDVDSPKTPNHPTVICETIQDDQQSSVADSSSQQTSKSESKVTPNHKDTQCYTQRAALLKSMLNFLKKAVQDSTFSDCIRHLMDGSLPKSLRHIIGNASYYGSTLFLLAIELVSTYVYQEPALLSSLQEIHLTKDILDATLDRPLPPTREVLAALPNTFTALCLNNAGLQAFQARKPFEKIFRVLISPDYLPAMRRRKGDLSNDTPTCLGNAMDELMRHQPSLRADVVAAIINLLKELCELGDNPNFVCSTKPIGKLTDLVANPVSADLRAPPHNSTLEAAVFSDDEDEDDEDSASPPVATDREIAQPAVLPKTLTPTKVPTAQSETIRTPVPLVDFILNVMRFLDAILTNNSTDDHVQEFLRQDGLIPLLKLMRLRNLPIDFPTSTACASISSVCRSISALARDPKVVQEALKCLDDVLNELEVLRKSTSTLGGSILLEEYANIANSTNITDPNILSNLTPTLHSMSSAHAYIVMFSCINRSNHLETRNICINHWGKDHGLDVLNKMSRLYMALMWESTVILSLDKKEQSAQSQKQKNPSDVPYNPAQGSRRSINVNSASTETDMDDSHLDPSDKTDSKTVRTETTQTSSSMDVDDTSKSSSDRRSKSRNRRVHFVEQSKLIKPLLPHISRLAKGIAELFTLLVKLSVGSPLRHRRNNHAMPNPPTVPSIAAQNVASVFAKLITEGLSLEIPPNLPNYRPTFFICFSGFTQSMLFDERKNPFHLMLRDLMHAGGIDAFFKTFEWLSSEGSVDQSQVDDSSPLASGPQAEFLEFWLSVLEKLVNPKMILETPHTMAPKSNSALNYVPFDPIQYLITVHKRAFDAIDYLWMMHSWKSFSDEISEHILLILCHLLKGETIINDHLEKEKESENQSADASSLSTAAPISANVSQVSNIPRNEYGGVNQDHFQHLVDMGFAREAVIDALMQCQTIEQATDFLLTAPQSSYTPNTTRRQPAVGNSATSSSQDVDMATEESATDDKATAVDASINMSSALKTVATIARPQKEEPLSKARIDVFTDNLLPGALRLMDELPTTVFKVCDLILTVAQRNGEAWCESLLNHLLNDIIEYVKRLLEMAEPLRASDNKSFNEWASQLKKSPEAHKAAFRIHLYSLLFEEMKIQCANLLCKSNTIDTLIALLEVGLDMLSLSKQSKDSQDDQTPKWLAPTILLIDLYEKGAVASHRRAPLLNNMERTWQYFDERTGRWTPHMPLNNKIIDTAYKNGEQFARYTVGRKHYLAQFCTMLQINEESSTLRPIMMSLTPVAEKDDKTSDALLPTVPILKSHQTQTLVKACVGFMQLPIDTYSLQAVMRLAFRLTRDYEMAVMFAERGGIRALQSLPESVQFTGFVSLATLIIRHVLEEPTVLHQTMEKVIRTTIQHCQHNQREMHYILRVLGPAACRNEEIFKKLATEILRIAPSPTSRRDEDETRGRADLPQLIKLLPPKPPAEPIKPSSVTRRVIEDLLDSLTVPIQKAQVIYVHPVRMNQATSGVANDIRHPGDPSGARLNPSANIHSEYKFQVDPGELKSANEAEVRPKPKEHNPMLNHSIVLRLLAELTRSYSVVPKIIAEHTYVNDHNIPDDTTALAFILDNILPTTQTHSDRDGPPLARIFLASLAACNHCVEAQIAVVNEVKASLNRASSMPEGCEKHARLQSLATMIGTMIDCCPAVSSQQSGARHNNPAAHQQRLSNNIVRLFVRKGLVTDLARIPNSLDLSAPYMFATVNAILKPLETLSRFVNLPGQPGQSRPNAPPTKKTCSSSSSSSDLPEDSNSQTLHMETSQGVEASGQQFTANNSSQTVAADEGQSGAAIISEGINDEIANVQEFEAPTHVVVRPLGGSGSVASAGGGGGGGSVNNERNSESRDNVVNSNGNESESGEGSRSEDEDEDEEDDNGEVSGVDEREEDADDEDDDEDEDDEDEDPVDDEEAVDDDEGDEDENLNAFGESNQFEDVRIYNGSLTHVLSDIEEAFAHQNNAGYPNRLDTILPMFDGPLEQHESSAPTLPPPPGNVGLTHPLLLRRMEHVQSHGQIQAANAPPVMGRSHRYSRPRMIRNAPVGGQGSQWHSSVGSRQPHQTILQQLLGPNTVQEVMTLTNHIVGPGRLFVAGFQDWLATEDELHPDNLDPHLVSSSNGTALATIPLVMARWNEESRILDGPSLYDCLTNIKLDIVATLERFRDEDNLDRQEKRKKMVEDDEQAQQKKCKEPAAANVPISQELQIPSGNQPVNSAMALNESQSDQPNNQADPPSQVSMEPVQPVGANAASQTIPVVSQNLTIAQPQADQASQQQQPMVQDGGNRLEAVQHFTPIEADHSEDTAEGTRQPSPPVLGQNVVEEMQSSEPSTTVEEPDQLIPSISQPTVSEQPQPTPVTQQEAQRTEPSMDNPSEGEIPDGVDPSFLAALPDDIRQEVLAEQWRLRRIERAANNRQSATAAPASSSATDQPSTSSGTTSNFPEVNPEFLAALPVEVQEEVLAQQRAEQQRQAALNSNPDQPVDPATFIQTLAPNLRRQVLADMDDSLLSLLPPELNAEAQALRREMLTSNASASSTLSRLLRTAAAGRMQRARYTITSVPDHVHNQQSWSWALNRTGPLHDDRSNRTLLALSRDSKFKGRQLLDCEALTCLVILLFVEEPKLNISRLHRVLRNLSYHQPTRQWVVQSIMSIIERAKTSDESARHAPTPIKGGRRQVSKISEVGEDVSKLNHSFSWPSISMDAALGCRASVFTVQKSALMQSSASTTTSGSLVPYSGKDINVHIQAAPSVCRHMLEALIALAKSFPQHFFPEGLQINDDSTSDSDTNTPLGLDFWELLARLNSFMNSLNKKGGRGTGKQAQLSNVPGNQNAPATTDAQLLDGSISPLATLMGFLAHPIIKKNFILTDRLLHLLATISNAFPIPSIPVYASDTGRPQYARRSHPPHMYYPAHGGQVSVQRQTAHRSAGPLPPLPTLHDPYIASDSADPPQTSSRPLRTYTAKRSDPPVYADPPKAGKSNDPAKPKQPLVAKHYLKLAVDVLTSKSCSEEGLDDVTALLSRLSKCCTATRAIVLELLMDGARQLGRTVCHNIAILQKQLREYNSKLRSKVPSSSANDGSSPNSKGLVQDRFTNDMVIITTPSGSSKSGREVQLPSMTNLTSKNSSQAFLLRILKVIIQLRETPKHHSSSSNHHPKTLSASNQQQLNQVATPDHGATNPSTEQSTSDQQVPAGQSAMEVDQTGTSQVESVPAAGQSTDVTMKIEDSSAGTSAKQQEESLSIELQLDDLWETLSQCLLELAETPDHHAVLVLQPAVEVFFLVHSPGLSQRNGTHHDDHVVDKNSQTAHIDQEVAPIDPTDGGSAQQSEITGQTSSLSYDTRKFLKFAETHRVVLNHILRQSTTPLSQGPFAVLVDHTRILDFDVKRRYFRQELERLDEGIRRDDLGIHVRRDNVFEESFRELHRRMAEEWKNRFFVVFHDEEGQDAGGLLREWYTIISREIFNPMYALFTTSPGDRVTYMINSASHCNTNHLTYFKFVGRVIAKAIYDNKLLDCYFTRSFYKHILGKPVKYTDMESEDYSFYQGLVFLLEHDVKELGYELTFSVEVREFGVVEVRELKANGSNIPVTEENKHEYVRLVCQEKMTGSIRKQLNAFLEGFYDIIPKRLISIFNEQELELLISGLPNFDIDDLKASTEYHKYLPNSLQIQWFWRALRSFDRADRAKLLQFVTGTSKVPLQGFASLEGMNGVQKFQIHRDERSTDRLPSAHTCFNQLDLPVYETYDKLRYMLLKAIQECSEGFGLA